jgi:hypothetical protein
MRDTLNAAATLLVIGSIGLRVALGILWRAAWTPPRPNRNQAWRCKSRACVDDDGCEQCRTFRCVQCKQLRGWDEGGCPDPRCDYCVIFNQE